MKPEIIGIIVSFIIGITSLVIGVINSNRQRKSNKELIILDNKLKRSDIIIQERYQIVCELIREFRICYHELLQLNSLVYEHQTSNIVNANDLFRKYLLSFNDKVRTTQYYYQINRFSLIGELNSKASKIVKVLENLFDGLFIDHCQLNLYEINIDAINEQANSLDKLISNYEDISNQYFELND